ncbi:hypothetical protein ACFOON_05970 [Novosphingobium piscinae]|uniref:Uncharacterized protein n=1 Tax=Novosphingobium piscinae TaxID=1507448 RepID=A0A7X1G157_9SPHN|nr:hypothetical protein [Novosphingobium piscinae]MBC2670760.1 hypothetical protein [Novosphingobium piscinae]
MAGRSKTGTDVSRPSGTAAGTPAEAAPEAPESPAVPAFATVLLTDLVLRGGSALLRGALDRSPLGRAASAGHAVVKGTGKIGGKIGGKTGGKTGGKGRSLGQTLLGTAAVRIATRSVPGAIIVGGALLAKTLYDRKRGKSG